MTVAMNLAFVDRIGPNTLQAITNITPGISGIPAGTAEVIGNNTVRISYKHCIYSNYINPKCRLHLPKRNTHSKCCLQTYPSPNINIQEGHFYNLRAALAGMLMQQT